MDDRRNVRKHLLWGVLLGAGVLVSATALRAEVPTIATPELATRLAAFFISPPPAPPVTVTNTSPPPTTTPPPPTTTGSGGGTPTPPPPPPPPPSGGGSPPPGGGGSPPPPPTESPEPASIVTALLGVGLASLAAWRRRGRKQVDETSRD